jgi:hypothetical protein
MQCRTCMSIVGRALKLKLVASSGSWCPAPAGSQLDQRTYIAAHQVRLRTVARHACCYDLACRPVSDILKKYLSVLLR